MPKAENFFTAEQKAKILAAIKDAEQQTSGEIRLFIEDACDKNLLDRAAEIFAKLNMHKTALRNGVLFYLAVSSRKFAILGDAGINKAVPPGFWDEIKNDMQEHFKQEAFTEGLDKAIHKAGTALKQFFPHQKNDVNELSDDIVFGDN